MYFKNWTKQEDRELIGYYRDGMTYANMTKYLQRTENSLRVRASILSMRGKLKLKPMLQNGKHKKPVRCIETGETWESLKECAASLGCSNSNVGNHIRYKVTLYGRNYEYINN